MNRRPLRVAIIGTAKRSDYLYGPLIKALTDEVELVSVWGRHTDSVERLGKSLGVPAYTDMDKLMRETAPELGIVSVNYHANGEVGLMAVQAGLHVLLETPIAHKLSEADAIIAAAEERGLKIEIAEQFHRRPMGSPSNCHSTRMRRRFEHTKLECRCGAHRPKQSPLNLGLLLEDSQRHCAFTRDIPSHPTYKTCHYRQMSGWRSLSKCPPPIR